MPSVHEHPCQIRLARCVVRLPVGLLRRVARLVAPPSVLVVPPRAFFHLSSASRWLKPPPASRVCSMPPSPCRHRGCRQIYFGTIGHGVVLHYLFYMPLVGFSSQVLEKLGSQRSVVEEI